VAEFDPCAPLHSLGEVPLSPPSAPRLTGPHQCAVDYSDIAGQRRSTSVIVGAAFDTAGRLDADHIEIGGLSGYQQRREGAPDVDASWAACQVDLPLSATRSMLVTAPDGGGPLAVGCTGARRAALAVAIAMADPRRSARHVPLGPPASAAAGPARTACDLLRAVPDITLYGFGPGDGRHRAHPDICLGHGDPDAREVAVETDYGPSPGEQAVPSTDGDPSCDLTERATGVPDPLATSAPERAYQRIVVRVHPGSCDDAREIMRPIREYLAHSPAPERLPVPARLGFPIAHPDDIRPAACGIAEDLGECRDAYRVPPPVGAAAVRACATSASLDSADGTPQEGKAARDSGR
jgi:hypothetical protein